jgi:hypothetical protein
MKRDFLKASIFALQSSMTKAEIQPCKARHRYNIKALQYGVEVFFKNNIITPDGVNINIKDTKNNVSYLYPLRGKNKELFLKERVRV